MRREDGVRFYSSTANTNLLHTNLLHSISRKIGHVIQIVVHQFVHEMSAEKIRLKKMVPLYPQVRGNT